MELLHIPQPYSANQLRINVKRKDTNKKQTTYSQNEKVTHTLERFYRSVFNQWGKERTWFDFRYEDQNKVRLEGLLQERRAIVEQNAWFCCFIRVKVKAQYAALLIVNTFLKMATHGKSFYYMLCFSKKVADKKRTFFLLGFIL